MSSANSREHIRRQRATFRAVKMPDDGTAEAQADDNTIRTADLEAEIARRKNGVPDVVGLGQSESVLIGDQSAGNATAGIPGRITLVIIRVCVDDKRRTIRVEHGIRTAFFSVTLGSWPAPGLDDTRLS
jgi:hypothetical protein